MAPLFKKNKESINKGWPAFTDGKRAIIRWTNSDETRRVYIIENIDSTYGKWIEVFSKDPYDNCWIAEHADNSIYETIELAEKEIEEICPWIKSAKQEFR